MNVHVCKENLEFKRHYLLDSERYECRSFSAEFGYRGSYYFIDVMEDYLNRSPHFYSWRVFIKKYGKPEDNRVGTLVLPSGSLLSKEYSEAILHEVKRRIIIDSVVPADYYK